MLFWWFCLLRVVWFSLVEDLRRQEEKREKKLWRWGGEFTSWGITSQYPVWYLSNTTFILVEVG
jgi:hypothetical protein